MLDIDLGLFVLESYLVKTFPKTACFIWLVNISVMLNNNED